LELGSGAGFIRKIIPQVITSDVLKLPNIKLVCSAHALSFMKESISAVYMLDALHHVPDAECFFHELQRCLRPGAIVALVEPARTIWGRFIWQHFHHEAFDDKTPVWKLPPGGPLSTANSALPWIIFERDKDRFAKEFPDLRIVHIEYVCPFSYLLSGGFSYKQFLPNIFYSMLCSMEYLLSPLNRWLGLFMRVIVKKMR